MTVSRRTALSMLGLGAAGAATVEDISAPVMPGGKPSGYHFGASSDRIIAALRRLADDIESGGSHVTDLTVSSKVTNEDFLLHTLAVCFAMKTEPSA